MERSFCQYVFLKFYQKKFVITILTDALFDDIIKYSVMKGAIVVNPFLVPKESVFQAQRLKEEFENLGVSAIIVSDTFLHTILDGEKLSSSLENCDFIVYLDKDKYQSEILSKLGIRLFNTHQAIRLCDDKAQTYIALSKKGIKMPKTIFGALCYSQNLAIKQEWADEIAKAVNYPVIIKESFGSMGKGVYKAENKTQLLELMEKVKLKPHLFQEFIDFKSGIDVRVIVIGKKAVCAMERHNDNDFRSNVGQGGYGKKLENFDKFAVVAEHCASVLGLDYCGVDLLYTADGQPCVCEVNSNAFISAIENVTGVNVAKAYAEYVVTQIRKDKI